MGFSRQKYWSWLSFPSPEYLPNPGIEPGSPVLQAVSCITEGFFTREAPLMTWGVYQKYQSSLLSKDCAESGPCY